MVFFCVSFRSPRLSLSEENFSFRFEDPPLFSLCLAERINLDEQFLRFKSLKSQVIHQGLHNLNFRTLENWKN